ncbi:MAG: histidinol-phosphatase, partial [Candidatus Hydrogenedens sp.]|nr:histidinol-phosphatase [Candidatus Hydrogenedens sp.]
HPTGRLLLARHGYVLDMEKVADAAAANGVALEINANPVRLDLDWRHVRRARDKGVKFVIGPDAHRVRGLHNIPFGVGVARKGWLGPEDVLNCRPVGEFLRCLRKG